MRIIHVVSVSGGKDSAATLLVAIARFGVHRVRGIFCDTGNEHQAVYDYLDYLEQAAGVHITRLKADFSSEIASKRMFIARDQRTRRAYATEPVLEADGVTPVPRRNGYGQVMLDKKGDPMQKMRKIGGGECMRWTNKAKRRALAALHPTGNPFLDLCLWKGRFPSRKAQFCTEELKRNMAVAYQLELIEQGNTVISWQGVRRDESQNRRNAKKFEPVGGGLFIFRPLVEWTVVDVFTYCASKGVQPNPLYKQGMGRVGCMPCINANKGEMHEIAQRFPDHIKRISEWEALVLAASKRGGASFIHAPTGGKTVKNSQDHAKKNDIYAVVEWAKTSRGGRQFSLLTELEDSSACSSSYGLCE